LEGLSSNKVSQFTVTEFRFYFLGCRVLSRLVPYPEGDGDQPRLTGNCQCMGYILPCAKQSGRNWKKSLSIQIE